MNKVFDSKNKCCGCTACYESCPEHAIEMIQDEEGFFYPKINQKLCVDCGICKKVCGFYKKETLQFNQRYYAAKSKVMEERVNSRSGGAFFCAAKSIIALKGIVYGAVLDEDNIVKFKRAVTTTECLKMQGSKYVECDIIGVYPLVKHDLQNEKLVLFSGTACQVAGLYGYLKRAVSKELLQNLYTMDIVCHGVISRKIFSDYIDFVENKYSGKVTEFNFRDKSFGWNTHIETFIINGKKYSFNNYTQLFYSNCALRPSCGECQFANYNRPGDISIADFWGVNKEMPNFDDNKGVSAILVNSENGEKLLDRIQVGMEMVEVSKSICTQPNLHKPSAIPDSRKLFWDIYKDKGILGILKKFGRYDALRRLLWRFRDLPKLQKNKNGG